jgi:Flp pilus assembly protein TadG
MNKERRGGMEGSALASNERGAVAVMVAIMLPVLLGFAALTIDIGQALVAKNELQDAADAGALAGARRLGTIYQGLTPAAQVSYTLASPVPIISDVQNVASQNYGAGRSITVDVGDINIGQWNSTNNTFTVTAVNPDAVRVTARLENGQTNGPVSTFLANIWNITSVDVRATATAALTGVGTTNPADLQTPFGISEFRFNDPNYCDAPIKFAPTNDPASCGGWQTFTANPNANTLRNQIDGMIPTPPTFTSPATQAGATSLEFYGGNVANALNNFYNLYVSKRDATGAWDVLVPVYQSSDCSNPNTAMLVVGYASMKITNVIAPPAGQLVLGTIQCNLVTNGPTHGGGGSFGTKGSIPGLVQ